MALGRSADAAMGLFTLLAVLLRTQAEIESGATHFEVQSVADIQHAVTNRFSFEAPRRKTPQQPIVRVDHRRLHDEQQPWIGPDSIQGQQQKKDRLKMKGKMLKDKDVAKIFGVKPQTVRVWRMRGVGPPYILAGDRTVRFDPVEVENYIKTRQRKSTKRKAK